MLGAFKLENNIQDRHAHRHAKTMSLPPFPHVSVNGIVGRESVNYNDHERLKALLRIGVEKEKADTERRRRAQQQQQQAPQQAQPLQPPVAEPEAPTSYTDPASAIGPIQPMKFFALPPILTLRVEVGATGVLNISGSLLNPRYYDFLTQIIVLYYNTAFGSRHDFKLSAQSTTFEEAKELAESSFVEEEDWEAMFDVLRTYGINNAIEKTMDDVQRVIANTPVLKTILTFRFNEWRLNEWLRGTRYTTLMDDAEKSYYVED
jgi:hypothetical protein